MNIQISPAVVPAYMYSPLGSTIAFVYVLINPELGNWQLLEFKIYYIEPTLNSKVFIKT